MTQAPQVKLPLEYRPIQAELNRVLSEMFKLLQTPVPSRKLQSIEGSAREVPRENEIFVVAAEAIKRIGTKLNGEIWYTNLNNGSQSPITSTYAPADAQYVVSSTDSRLTNADVLTGTANQVIVTPGTNINTLSTPQNIHTAATPQFARLGLGAAADGTLSINATNGAAIDGAVTINDTGNAVDFRVESDGDANALFVHGTNNTVQVGAATASDSAKFYVSGKISASGEVEINGDLNHDGSNVGFYGVAPAVRASAIIQTYSTADRTLSAYTADNEGSAYSGIDNLQLGSVYAQVADLNALRTAYENLRALSEDVAQLLNAVVDDLQSLGLEQ